MRRQPAREENERHDDEADDGADDQTEKQRELIFALAEAVHRTPEFAGGSHLAAAVPAGTHSAVLPAPPSPLRSGARRRSMGVR